MSTHASENAGRADDASKPPAPVPYAPVSVVTAGEPAHRFLGPWLRFLVPAAVGIAVDLWTKALTFPDGIARIHVEGGAARLAPVQGAYHDAYTLIPNVLVMQTTANQGAVFGIGQGKVAIFLAFSVFALALISWVFWTSRRNQWVIHLALGLITAGAIGNLYDRAAYGAVRDFLRFTVNWYPYIFNIADVLLCVGVPLLMFCWVFAKDPGARPKSG